ncbi:hypothetical protein Q3G72_019427 [Acer saccharum]|nr:hypothetical protein Q3G72_019427 [Acer saccharum]
MEGGGEEWSAGLELGLATIQGSEQSNTVLEAQQKAVEENSKTLEAGKLKKQAELDSMCIDGPGVRPPELNSNKDQRKLVGNITAKKTVRRRSLSSSHRVSSPKNSDGRGKLKIEYDILESPIFSSNRSVISPGVNPKCAKER